MKAIVDAAIPTLSRLGTGEYWNLSVHERISLARWSTLFSMSFEFADKETVCVSPEERAWFKSSPTPSHFWDIAIGSAETGPLGDTVFHRGGIFPPEMVIGHNLVMAIAIAFDDLLIFAFYREIAFEFDISSFYVDNGLQQLWPLSNQEIITPVKTYNNAEFVALVPSFFARLLKHLS